MASPRGLRRVTLPKPTEMEALALLRRETAQGAAFDNEAFAPLAEGLRRYFRGDPVDFSLVGLDLDGLTPFQRRVLEAVRGIPRGQVQSYGQVAAAIGRPLAARAVGTALAGNPLCLLIPCHRVVASDGRLGGFGGGTEMKRRMLALEGVPLGSP